MPTPRAFDALVAQHQRDVLRVCRSILRDDHLSADAAQETFLRLWTRSSQGSPPQFAHAWLRKVAVTTSLDLLRRRERQRAEPEVEPVAPPHVPSDAVLRSCFEHAIAELSEGQRTIFLLRHDGELSLSEIAAALDVALPTVKTQFARACVKLQHKLARYRPGTGTES
ncbi:MAG: RNA polymerase sigma factor [Planctomycetota bacterium]